MESELKLLTLIESMTQSGGHRFSIKMGLPIASHPQATEAKLVGPEGTISGAIMSYEDLPPDVPCLDAEMYADSCRLLAETLLAGEDILRVGQASDQHRYSPFTCYHLLQIDRELVCVVF